MRRRILIKGKDTDYEYVDLGLPSGVMWATKNIGAEKKSDYGLYFQWADISGYTIAQLGSGEGQKLFSFYDYKYASGATSYGTAAMTRYNDKDYRTTLIDSDDAAKVNIGSWWRMPTSSDTADLSASTTSAMTTVNGENGIMLTSKKDNTKKLFFPGSGYFSSGATNYGYGSHSYYGYYWLNEVFTNDKMRARCLTVGNEISWYSAAYRYQGLAIRGVIRLPMWPVLNVLFYNTETNTKQVFSAPDWPSADLGWTPIAIEVVPKEHNRYGDGSGGFIALKLMTCKDPENGTTSSTITSAETPYWGCYNTTVGNYMFNGTKAADNTYYNANIPYQMNYGYTSCTYNNVTGTASASWPYQGWSEPTSAANTTYSSLVGMTATTSNYAIGDLNGIRNTAALYVKTKDSSQWTASTVPNLSGATSCPAACCCARYKTVGTNSFLDVYSGITENNLYYGTSASTKENRGYWYMPALGEVCYLATKRFELRYTTEKLIEQYGSSDIKLFEYNLFISSTSKGDQYAWTLGLAGGGNNGGSVGGSGNRSGLYYYGIVRPYLRYKDGD